MSKAYNKAKEGAKALGQRFRHEDWFRGTAIRAHKDSFCIFVYSSDEFLGDLRDWKIYGIPVFIEYRKDMPKAQ